MPPSRRSHLLMASCILLISLVALLVVPSPAADSDADVDLTVSTHGQAFTNSIGMKLVPIRKGKFMMGSPQGEKDRHTFEDQHEVEITRDFYLGATEVTQKQYKQIMGTNPSGFTRGGSSAGDVQGIKDADLEEFPVERVTWQDAQEFLKKLSALPQENQHRRVYRLPTEAEWEYACRAGTRTAFYTGADLTAKQANFRALGLERTCKVASFAPNAWGLYDMHGNVWEWCNDWFDDNYYKVSPRLDPRGPQKGDNHVMRGGCWFDNDQYQRSACRLWNGRGVTQDRGLGFRVAMTAAR